ncbi:hypothetical protein HY570_00570, partial [Candidatus Micrarchaeota archaeon]|nr:hypothetical protein [Candidatus Micrarchaeota archaeon]
MQKLRSSLLLLVIGFFLFGCISKTSEGYFDPVQNLTEWVPIGLVAIVISFLLVGIAYMIAELVKMPELNAWAKNELYESIISTFFLGSVLAVMILLNVFIAAVSLSTEDASGPLGVPVVEGGHKILPPHFEVAEAYLKEVDTRILDTYISLIIADQYIDALGTLTVSAPVDPFAVGLRVNVGLTPAAGLAMISNTLITVSDTLAIMDVVLIAQSTLLKFIEETMFSIFLPLGIVLRAFPITRRLGSTLIALAITLYVVYPLTLGINHAVIKAVPTYDNLERLDTQKFNQIVTDHYSNITQPQDEVVYEGERTTVEWQILGVPTVDSCSVVIKESGTNVNIDQNDCKINKHVLVASQPFTLSATETHRIYTLEVTVEGKDGRGNPLP